MSSDFESGTKKTIDLTIKAERVTLDILNLLDFARDLIINGAENEEVGCTLISVGY